MNSEVKNQKCSKFHFKMMKEFLLKSTVVFAIAFVAGCAPIGGSKESAGPPNKTSYSTNRINLDIKILSAKRTGRGGHNIEFTASFYNKGDKMLMLDRTGLSLDIRGKTEEGKTNIWNKATAITFKTVRFSPIARTVFYEKNNRYFEIVPGSTKKLTFETAYIGDQNIYERLYYGWADNTRNAWLEGCFSSKLQLKLNYIVPYETFHDDLLRNASIYDWETVCSPEFSVTLPPISDTDPPILLSLVSAHMKTDLEAKEGKDRIEFSIRVESTATNAISLDIKHFGLSVNWFDEETLLRLASFGREPTPTSEMLDLLEQGRYLYVPPRGTRIITLTTGVMGEGDLSDLYPEIRKSERIESGYENVPKWCWNNRVAEKYSVSVLYYMPNISGHPDLLVNLDPKEDLIKIISSEPRETDLGQTRFVGEAWFESPQENPGQP